MRILVFQHLDVEHPGVLREFWDEDHHSWTAVELDRGEPIPELDPFDLLVVMGGPMDVWQEGFHPWLVPEKAAIRRWVRDMGRPYVGICLGHQLLADALGGRVGLMAGPEVGLAEVDLTDAGRQDPALAGLKPRFLTMQWHGAAILGPPSGMQLLARNAACPIQAVRWGRHAYGFQYHVEITAEQVTGWQGIPEYKASLEKALGKERAANLASEVIPELPGFRVTTQRVYDNLLKIINRH